MNRLRLFFTLMVLLPVSGRLGAQEGYSAYLVKARTYLSNGDTLRAAKSYQVYTRLTGLTDSLFESNLYAPQAADTLEVPSRRKSKNRAPSAGHNFTERAFGINMSMVYVRGGDFLMFDQSGRVRNTGNDELPLRYQSVGNYYIGQCEVTQGQWTAIMGGGIAKQRDMVNPKMPLYGSGRHFPVYYVSYEEAEEFCRRLSARTGLTYRLPTEAEWEYAAQGGARSRHFIYSGADNIDNACWYAGNSGGAAHHVGNRRPNELGIFDMSGNVLEWCSDMYGSDRVCRGGGWNSDSRGCRISGRTGCPTSKRDSCIGFRVVCIP